MQFECTAACTYTQAYICINVCLSVLLPVCEFVHMCVCKHAHTVGRILNSVKTSVAHLTAAKIAIFSGRKKLNFRQWKKTAIIKFLLKCMVLLISQNLYHFGLMYQLILSMYGFHNVRIPAAR